MLGYAILEVQVKEDKEDYLECQAQNLIIEDEELLLVFRLRYIKADGAPLLLQKMELLNLLYNKFGLQLVAIEQTNWTDSMGAQVCNYLYWLKMPLGVDIVELLRDEFECISIDKKDDPGKEEES